VTDLDDDLRAWCDTFVALVAELVVSRGQYTDTYFRARRGQEMSLESEMGWHLLRPLTFSTREVAVSAALEPAYAMGGDAFDYAYNSPTLHVALFDAMGHGIQAALTSTLAVGSYRHSRRQGADLLTTYKAVDCEIAEHRRSAFATGVFAELDCPTGRMQWLNAGHPAPMLLRERSVMRLDTTPALPLGVGGEFADHLTLDVGQVGLQPGDRVLFFSDGCTEAATLSGEAFGEERLGDFLVREQTAGLALAETLRRLSHAVLDHAGGTLADDATVLLVEYRGAESG
jgi:serine phosphatase RsbU (regulator of sigma subunit)